MNSKKESIPSKLKCLLSIKPFKSFQNLPTKLEFTEHHLKLSFPHLASDSLSFLNDLLSPLFNQSKQHYSLNYSFIQKSGTNSSFTAIAFELTNPILNTSITFILSKLETQTMLFKKKLPECTIKSIIAYLRKKNSYETKHLIEKYISLLSMLKECLEPQKRENQIIETILVNSYYFGKRYYEKYHSEIKMKQKLIKSEMKKQLSKQLKQFEDLISEHDKMKRNIDCSTFDTMINEFKIRTSLLIEENINFLFKIINAENDVQFCKVDKYSITKKMINVNESISISNNTFNNNMNKELIFKKQTHYKENNANNNNNKSSILFNNTNKKGETLAQLNLNISYDSIMNKNISNNTFNTLYKDSSTKSPQHHQLGFSFSKVFTPLHSNNNNNSTHNNTFSHIINNKTDITSTSTKNTSKGMEPKQNKPSKKKNNFSAQNADLLETPKFFSNAQKKSHLFTKSKVIKNHNNNLNKTFNGPSYQHKQMNNSFEGNLNNSAVISNEGLFKMNKYENENVTIMSISKQIEQLCRRHSFFPPVDTFNIFLNTAEIIHRRFFEESFQMYFPEMFEVELDKDNLIKIESLYNMFMYLRAMKGFLFTEKNKMCMTSILFVSDDLIF